MNNTNELTPEAVDAMEIVFEEMMVEAKAAADNDIELARVDFKLRIENWAKYRVALEALRNVRRYKELHA